LGGGSRRRLWRDLRSAGLGLTRCTWLLNGLCFLLLGGQHLVLLVWRQIQKVKKLLLVNLHHDRIALELTGDGLKLLHGLYVILLPFGRRNDAACVTFFTVPVGSLDGLFKVVTLKRFLVT